MKAEALVYPSSPSDPSPSLVGSRGGRHVSKREKGGGERLKEGRGVPAVFVFVVLDLDGDARALGQLVQQLLLGLLRTPPPRRTHDAHTTHTRQSQRTDEHGMMADMGVGRLCGGCTWFCSMRVRASMSMSLRVRFLLGRRFLSCSGFCVKHAMGGGT
jgi:hypothetical protein